MQPPSRLPGSIPGVTFGGIALPSSDFQAVRDGRRAPMFYVDVDLSTARSFAAGTQLNLALAANFLYIDQRLNSGVAAIHFQDQNQGATPVTMFPGALWKIPFTQLGLENTAQAGQTIRLIYGVDVDALPISAAGVTVLNALNINDQVNSVCQTVISGISPAVGTNVTTLLAIASNTNGARVRSWYLLSIAGVGGLHNGLITASAVAPVSQNSQANCVILGFIGNSTTTPVISQENTLGRAIPAGWGIFCTDVATVATAVRTAGISFELL